MFGKTDDLAFGTEERTDLFQIGSSNRENTLNCRRPDDCVELDLVRIDFVDDLLQQRDLLIAVIYSPYEQYLQPDLSGIFSSENSHSLKNTAKPELRMRPIHFLEILHRCRIE